MNRVKEKFESIASAIRKRKGTTDKIQCCNFENEILSIGEGAVEYIPDGYVKPEGTLEISANGEYDVTNYKNVEVAVMPEEGSVITKLHEEVTSDVYRDDFHNLAEHGIISYVGGGTYYTSNLAVFNDIEETTLNGITYSAKDGVITLNGTATGTWGATIRIPLVKTLPIGIYTMKHFGTQLDGNTSNFAFRDSTNKTAIQQDFKYANYSNTKSTTTTISKIEIYVPNGMSFENYKAKVVLVKGTEAPSSFHEGTNFIHTKVTKITSGTEIIIPEYIQHLPGYGVGLDFEHYNYIDFTNQKYVQWLEVRPYKAGDENNGNLVTDYVNTIIKLGTPYTYDIAIEKIIKINDSINFASNTNDGVPVGIYVQEVI